MAENDVISSDMLTLLLGWGGAGRAGHGLAVRDSKTGTP